MTLTFLIAYLFYNDGIQTVIYAASTYGSEQLGFGQSVLIATILLIQFVAFGGALLFGRLAASYGAYRSILWGVFAWMVIVVAAMFLPQENVALFLLVGVAIGIVLGGTQALSRSFFSLLIPRGREGEYFALYNACERGTSWFGTFVFGVVFQLTGSYRPAIAGADRLLRARRVLPAPARPGARDPRGRQRGPSFGVSAVIAGSFRNLHPTSTVEQIETCSGWVVDTRRRSAGRRSVRLGHAHGGLKIRRCLMAERTLRGARLGGQSFEDERGIEFAARQQVGYRCPQGHEFEITMSVEADVPAVWECPRCGAEGMSTSGIEPEVKAEKPVRTHWDMLLERRSEKELEDILKERLELLRGGEIGPAHLHRANAKKRKATA